MLKTLMEIALPKMRGLLVMTMASISPSGREVPPTKSLRWRAKVLLPKFRLETAALHPKSPPIIFFKIKMTYIPEDGHRRWAKEGTTHQGAPGGPSVPWCLVLTRVAPSGSYLPQYFLYIRKQFSINFQLIWRCAK